MSVRHISELQGLIVVFFIIKLMHSHCSEINLQLYQELTIVTARQFCNLLPDQSFTSGLK